MDSQHRMEIIISLVYIVLIVSLNSLIVALFIRLKRSKKVTYSDCLFLNLTMSDLFIGMFSMTYELYDKFPPFRWNLGYALCVLFMTQINSQYICSCFGLLLLSAHRLLQLVMPLKVNENLSKLKVALILATWLVPYSTFLAAELLVRKPFLCNTFYPRQFIITTLTLFNIVPILAMIVINMLTFVFLLRKKRKKSQLRKGPKNAKSTTDKLEFKSVSQSVTNNQQTATTHSTKKKASSRIAKDLKGLICISLIVFALILTQSIYSIIEPIQFICFACFDIWTLLSLISNWLNFSFSILNPIILMTFHDSYRGELKALIYKSKC
jgi:hypothetical protein